MLRIDIYGNPAQTSHIPDLCRFIAALAASGCRLRAEAEYLDFLRRTVPEAQNVAVISDSRDADLALSIGGDGTFLTTTNRIADSHPAIMGINAGHLGYLSAADIADTDPDLIIAQITEGGYVTELRTLIEVKSNSELLPARPFALNEVAILKQDTAQMITVETSINGKTLAAFSGDGLLFSTPTGSTGYNLSVGGPIVSPRSASWVISPIAPHSLSMRPLVVPDDVTIDVTARSRAGNMLLAIDGRSTPLPVGTSLRLVKAPFCISVANFSGRHFIDTLRHKLYWAVR